MRQNRKSWPSHNYDLANENPDLLKTDELALWLGVSECFVRKYIPSTEWHHCYKRYGDHARAYFHSKQDIQDMLVQRKDFLQKVNKNQRRQQRRFENGDDQQYLRSYINGPPEGVQFVRNLLAEQDQIEQPVNL